jgi:hypothetical protein
VAGSGATRPDPLTPDDGANHGFGVATEAEDVASIASAGQPPWEQGLVSGMAPPSARAEPRARLKAGAEDDGSPPPDLLRLAMAPSSPTLSLDMALFYPGGPTGGRTKSRWWADADDESDDDHPY